MARYPEQTWHLRPAAQAALASIADRHPVKVRRPAPLAQVFAGGPDFVLGWNPNDDRVDELIRLENAAFETLEARTDTHTAYALLPRAEALVDAVVAGGAVARKAAA